MSTLPGISSSNVSANPFNIGSTPNISLGSSPSISLGSNPIVSPFTAAQPQANSSPIPAVNKSVAPVQSTPAVLPLAPAVIKPPVVTPTTVTKSDGTSINLQDVANFVSNYQNAQKNFAVTPSSTVSSDNLGGGTTTSDLLANRNALQSDVLNGTNTTATPSNNLLANVAGQVYQASQFSPQQVSAMQNLSDINNQIAAQQLAERRQIQDLQSDGSITKDQANQYISDFQTRANRQLADLATQQTAASNNLGVLNSVQQNQVTALQNYAGLLQPQSVAPGSTLYNPVTGVQYQGTGAAPAQIASTAQQLEQSAIQTGSVVTNADGSINHDYYTQQAQNYYNTGTYGNSTGTATSGNLANSGLSQINQSYVTTTQDGTQYVSQDKLSNLSSVQQQAAAAQYAAAGIPVLTTDQTSKIQNIDVTRQNLDGLQTLVTGIDPNTGQQVSSPLLGSGVFGRIGSAVSNTVSSATQSNPNTAAFNNYRLTAINTLQSLGAGSGGSRITASEIATAVDNLPNLTDNIETAKAKLSIVDGYLDKWQNELLPNNTSSAGNGGSIVQTQAGAVSTDW